MPRETLSMRKISEVLRLRLEQKLSVRQIAGSCRLARSTVSEYLQRARTAGLVWPLPPEMTEAQLDARLFPVQAHPIARAWRLKWRVSVMSCETSMLRCNCCGRSTGHRRRTGTVTANTASYIGTGWERRPSVCGRNTVPAKSCSSTMRATRSQSGIRKPGLFCQAIYLWPCWVAVTAHMRM